MKKYVKTILLSAVIAFLMIGLPYIKTPGSCGLTVPLAFTGAILGCGGEREPEMQNDSVDRSALKAAEIETEINSKTGKFKVTFIELGSVNCIPCKMMQPVMDKIKKIYPEQVKIVFHDVWTEEGKIYGQKYRIRAIPTQVFIDNNGSEYFRHEGFFSFEEIKKILARKGVK